MNIILNEYSGYIKSKYNIYYRNYKSSNSRASIICIHGILSDSRLFNNFATALVKYDYDVYAIDLPGYGLSEGEKGNVDFEYTIESIHDFIFSFNDKPFLLGFSLGTIYAIYYASRYKDIKGLILAASLFHPIRSELPEYANRIYKLYQENPEGKVNLLECIHLDDDKYNYILNDRLCNKEYKLAYLADIFIKATDATILEKVDCPVLILHGKYDAFTSINQVKETYRLIASKNKRLEILDTDHWLCNTFFYNGSKDSDVINIIKEWLSSV
ncbi:MAG: lysophospholipase [Candidatus Nitrosocaldaceae archaeon]|nr:MAG: lysophospholipase [Candidatus Nitrosocaldaceae archaeon]